MGDQTDCTGKTVPLAFGIFLEGVGHRDEPVTQVPIIQTFDRGNRIVDSSEVDESVAFGTASYLISNNLEIK